MALEFTYLTICRSFVPCHLSLFRYLSNFGEIDRFNVPSHRSLYIMHFLPISVSQDAGYWPSSFFRIFMDRRCQCRESWPNKLIYKGIYYKKWPKRELFLEGLFFIRGKSRAGTIGPSCRRGSQSEHRNRFILPTRGFSHILKSPIVTSLSLGTVDAPFVSSPCTSDLREKFLHQDMTWTMMKRTSISNRRSPYRHHLVLILSALNCCRSLVPKRSFLFRYPR